MGDLKFFNDFSGVPPNVVGLTGMLLNWLPTIEQFCDFNAIQVYPPTSYLICPVGTISMVNNFVFQKSYILLLLSHLTGHLSNFPRSICRKCIHFSGIIQ